MRRFTYLTLLLAIVLGLVLTAPAAAAPAQADRGAWAPNVAYAVNDTVTYGGCTYKVIQAHTSLTGWEPPNVPALFTLVSCGGATATNTQPAPTATRTNTTVAPTATRTNTPIGPTATRTNTPLGPTATRTNSPTATATSISNGANLALNKTATASSNETSAFTPNLAVDGNTATRWSSAFSDPQWLQVDLGATVNVSRVVLRWEAAYGSAYQIQTSNDATNWITIYSTGSGTGGVNDMSLTGSGRYIRMYGTARGTVYGYSLYEFEVYGTSGPTLTPGAPTSTPTRTSTPPAVTLTPTPTQGSASCAVQSAPGGKVLAGYWENWDGAANGVHPGMGWIPLSQVPSAYNVIDLAFPVILSDGTAEWFDGMDSTVKVPTPAEVCAAKAAGHWVLLSIGGANAAVDLSQTATVDKFISTIVPILKSNNFDGIDIDIESGLVAGSSWSANSTSQNNLIRLIDGVLAQMPSNFMLTMAPETAYVTGGQIAYGGPWGAYDPIIQRYLANGRLSWLQMQYYNGSMYGCPATSFSAGTVDGFVQQTQCMLNGFTVATGPVITIPAGKIVVGLPAQSGAGGGYMTPALVSQAYAQVSSIKGLMTWSINWDGSKGWTFANSKPY